MKIGDPAYWCYDGDVTECHIIDINDQLVKIQTLDGHIFGRLNKDDVCVYYEIWQDDLALTKEDAIKIIINRMDITRITYNMWRESYNKLKYQTEK